MQGKDVIRCFFNIICMLVAFYLDQFLQVFYAFPKKIERRFNLNEAGLVIIVALVTLFVLILIFWLYKRQLNEKNDWQFNQKPHWHWKKVLIAILGLVLIIVVNIVLQALLINPAKQVNSSNQEAVNRLLSLNGSWFKIPVAIIAPFCEEVIFRGMFFNTFFTEDTRLNKWLGIIVSGLIFAYAHDPGLSVFIFIYWGMGCVLAWVYMTTKDLRYSMMTHMLFNSLGLLVH